MIRISTVAIALIALGLRLAPFASVLRADGLAASSWAMLAATALCAVVTPFALWLACSSRDPAERLLALAVFAFDPLSIGAAYGASVSATAAGAFVPGPDAAIGTAACATIAGVVLALLATTARARRAGFALAGLAGVLAAVFAFQHAPAESDALFLAWSEFGPPALARVFAVVHHVGYAVLPLALWTFVSPARRSFLVAGAAALCVVLLVDRLGFARFASLAVFAPVITAAAVHAILELRRSAADPRDGALRAFGLVLVVVAVNAPVLASDALSRGPRLPQVRGTKSSPGAANASPAAELAVHTTLPDAFVGATAKTPPQRLPSGAELETLLGGPFRILLPVVNGRLAGGDDATLRAVERVVVPTSETRATRFDLYRFEVREYVRRGTP